MGRPPRTPMDARFKEVLQNFLPEFVNLFFPEIALQLQWDTIQFLDKETIAELGADTTQTSDIVASVQTSHGDAFSLVILIEVQAKRGGKFPKRVFDYYYALRRRYGHPVLPLVLYLSPGAGGITQEVYQEETLQIAFLRFHYLVVGLPDLAADEWQSKSPLAAALACKMRPLSAGKAQQKFNGLLQIARSAYGDYRKLLLADLLERFLSLADAEEAAYNQLRASTTSQEVEQMLSIYEERGIAEGMRAVLLRLGTRRFGAPSQSIRLQLEAIESRARLDALTDHLFDVENWDELLAH